MTTNAIAKLEIRDLRARKAPRGDWLARAVYFETAATNYEAGYARDLADWEAGTVTRTDLADPRTPEVAAYRAAFVEETRQTARDIRAAAPEA